MSRSSCCAPVTLSAAQLLGACPWHVKEPLRWSSLPCSRQSAAGTALTPGLLPALPGARQAPRARHIAGARAAPGLCAQPGMALRCAELHRSRPSALYNHHAIYSLLFPAFTDHPSAGCSQRPAGNHTSFSPTPNNVCHKHTNTQAAEGAG